MNAPICGVCCGERPECPCCEGTGVVNGELPKEAGWYYAAVGEDITLLEVNVDLEVYGLTDSPLSVGCANWHDVRNEPLVAWGPRIELTWVRRSANGD